MRYLPILLFVAACGASHAESAAPADVPPLPPISTTSVELLIQNKATIGLSDQQVVKLKGLQQELQAENDSVDAQLTDVEEQQSVRLMRMGPQDAKAADKKGHGGKGPKARRVQPVKSAAVTREDALSEQKSQNDAKMLQRAWKLLDPGQQAQAKAVLDRNGHQAPAVAPAPN